MLEDLFTYPETEGWCFDFSTAVLWMEHVDHQSDTNPQMLVPSARTNKERRLGTSWVQICCDYEVLRLWRSFFCLILPTCHVYLFKETGDFSVTFHGRKLLPRLGTFESLYYALDLNNESCHVTLEAQCFSDCSGDGRSNDCWTAYFKRTNSHAMSFKYPMDGVTSL